MFMLVRFTQRVDSSHQQRLILIPLPHALVITYIPYRLSSSASLHTERSLEDCLVGGKGCGDRGQNVDNTQVGAFMEWREGLPVSPS